MKLKHRHASEILILLLLTDSVLIALHLIHRLTPFLNQWHWSIESDLGYGEFFQYIKALWLVCSFAALMRLRGERSYFALMGLFGYLLIDDSLSVHERLGKRVAGLLDLQPMLGLRSVDFGELVVNGFAGVFFIIVVGGAYWLGSREFQRVCQRVGWLMGALILCGVGFDALHVLTPFGTMISLLLGLLEDGGEMVVMSVLCWYGVSLLGRRTFTG